MEEEPPNSTRNQGETSTSPPRTTGKPTPQGILWPQNPANHEDNSVQLTEYSTEDESSTTGTEHSTHDATSSAARSTPNDILRTSNSGQTAVQSSEIGQMCA